MQPQNEYDRIEHNLSLHPPENEHVGAVMDEIRLGAKEFAHLVDRLVPVGREKSLALTEIERACQDAIGGVARNQSAVLAALSAPDPE